MIKVEIKCRKEISNLEPYIPGKQVDQVRQEYGLNQITKLASNENPIGTAQIVQDLICRLASQVHLYPDGDSISLKCKLADMLQVNKSQLIVGNGSDEIFKLITESYILPSDQVIISESTFSAYKFAATLMGATVQTVPLNRYKYDLDAMLDCINKNTKIIFICNPNNPTGTIVGEQKLKEFLAQVPKNVLVVIDEAYYEYVEASNYPQTISLLSEYPNIIITRTFSKIYGLAALRVGYGIADEAIITNLSRVKDPFNVNRIAQMAALESLSAVDHLKQSRLVNEQGKDYLYTQLAKLGLEFVPTEANFILVNVEQDANKIFKKLLRKGVIIRSAVPFGLTTHFRVTIGTIDQNQLFISALKESL